MGTTPVFWLNMKCLLFFLFSCLVSVICTNGPQVEVSSGILEGKYMITKLGRKFGGFLAIPFAKPPVGDLRFKDPIPNLPWQGIRKATIDSSICTQRNPYIRSPIIEGEEDCLYLNVYTPQFPSYGSDPLPVMVFFHGGGWVCGAGTSLWYGPEILLDQEVVLVVPNFRLGPFGFLSTQDDVVPGNMALKDQVMALKWIQQNIAAFGGDPNRVTIFGESAGGASVHLHMVSSVSKGLFHRGISQSGTSLCPWAFAPKDEPLRNAQKLGNLFNCTTTSTFEMIECLRKIKAEDIIGTDDSFTVWDIDPMIPFKPVAEHMHDGAFLTEQPSELIKNGKVNAVPWITGITSSEGAIRAAGIVGQPKLLEEFDKKIHKLLPVSLFYEHANCDVSDVTQKLRKFYFGDRTINHDTFQDIVNLYTDGWFLTCLHKAVGLHLQHTSNPVYVYYFDYRGENSFSAVFGDPHRNYGVCHADELQYMFPVGDMLFPNNPPNETDKKIAEIITKIWANFAKTGNPNDDSNELEQFVWKPVTSDKIQYLHIKNETNLQMKESLLTERVEFWASLPIIEDNKNINRVQDEL